MIQSQKGTPIKKSLACYFSGLRLFVNKGRICRSGWVASVVGFITFAFVFMVALQWIGLHFADNLLVIQQEPCTADFILILGGECKSRVGKAVELYRRGYAPRILVTGRNEDTLIVQRLISAGVPKSAILVEPAAESTFENAAFTLPILKERNARKVLLVTSWYHSRRASTVFNDPSAKIEFFSIPTDTVPVDCINKDKWLREYVLMEYMKIAGYWVRHGVSPFRGLAFASPGGTGS